MVTTVHDVSLSIILATTILAPTAVFASREPAAHLIDANAPTVGVERLARRLSTSCVLSTAVKTVVLALSLAVSKSAYATMASAVPIVNTSAARTMTPILL